MIEHHFYVPLGVHGYHYNILIMDNGKVFVDRHEQNCKNNGCDVVNIRIDPFYTAICSMFGDWRNS